MDPKETTLLAQSGKAEKAKLDNLFGIHVVAHGLREIRTIIYFVYVLLLSLQCIKSQIGALFFPVHYPFICLFFLLLVGVIQ